MLPRGGSSGIITFLTDPLSKIVTGVETDESKKKWNDPRNVFGRQTRGEFNSFAEFLKFDGSFEDQTVVLDLIYKTRHVRLSMVGPFCHQQLAHCHVIYHC
jgi:hypothetical protein